MPAATKPEHNERPYSARWARLLVEPTKPISFVMDQRMLRESNERAERTALSAATAARVPSTATAPRPTADRP